MMKPVTPYVPKKWKRLRLEFTDEYYNSRGEYYSSIYEYYSRDNYIRNPVKPKYVQKKLPKPNKKKKNKNKDKDKTNVCCDIL